MSTLEEQLEQSRAARELDLMAAVLRGKPTVYERAATVEYELSEPMLIEDPYGHRSVLYRIRVERTQFPATGADEYLEVTGFMVEATKSGKAHAGKTARWRSLPDSLASTLANIEKEKP